MLNEAISIGNDETVSVGRLTRSLPLTRSNELPVDVARVPAAPFCESRKLSGLTQTPYSSEIAPVHQQINPV
jgi:hypothetical protein